ncbi:MAG: hypothetical protein E7Z87_01365 [Cyanobacteria bacterium SIG26]|nr:hypothetical protein [Cyanobacteria bacterium SIG26]
MVDAYLSVSSIVNKSVEKMGKACDTESKPNLIYTENEWRSFLVGIADLFGSGEITYDEAKRYVNISSSAFIKRNVGNKGYVDGFLEGLKETHESYGSRFSRKLKTLISGDNVNSKYIQAYANTAEATSTMQETIHLTKENIRLTQDLIRATDKNIKLTNQIINSTKSEGISFDKKQ